MFLRAGSCASFRSCKKIRTPQNADFRPLGSAVKRVIRHSDGLSNDLGTPHIARFATSAIFLQLPFGRGSVGDRLLRISFVFQSGSCASFGRGSVGDRLLRISIVFQSGSCASFGRGSVGDRLLRISFVFRVGLALPFGRGSVGDRLLRISFVFQSGSCAPFRSRLGWRSVVTD